ncbi:hypothetical protein ACFQ36_18395 [Arthrobacter sp. GCM10027362]|uniref:hypothetical protein n=1 Tax=Arthrobacter sp. GCM10027362 TaxID=3273379 RepID=UPI0036373B2D
MGSRPRYIVRSVKVAAGSFLTAAVGVMGMLGAAPAQAAAASGIAVHTHVSAAAAGTLVRRDSEALEPQASAAQLQGRSEARERIAGIRGEMQQAVSLGLVTQEQADRFTNQLAGRILRGL